jgi:hypothetical protein
MKIYLILCIFISWRQEDKRSHTRLYVATNRNIALLIVCFSFFFRTVALIGLYRYKKECTMHCKEIRYYNRSLGTEIFCFLLFLVSYYTNATLQSKLLKNCPLRSQMVMLKNQMSQVRSRVEVICRECSENPSSFHHFLYNKGLFYKTIKLNPTLMCPLAAAGACLLEA